MSLTIALAGNPNSGKTTLFNALTGASQYVGNWPGVTVEKKSGRLKGNKEITIEDLPGIYSLSPYTLEEVVSRKWLVTRRPDAIINIIDGTNLERNLYLTTQLLELGIPVVVAINMMDRVRKNGDRIDIKKLSAELDVPVLEISALKNEGVQEVAQRAIKAAAEKAPKTRSFSDEAEAALSRISDVLPQDLEEGQRRFFSIKLFERDEKAAELLSSKPNVEEIIVEAEGVMDDDAESIITNERYEMIATIIKDCYHKGKTGETISDKIDKIVTNRWLGLPIFALVMFLVYYISIQTIGTGLTDELNGFFEGPVTDWATNGLQAIGTASWLEGLIVSGIIAGVGAVLGFLPQMIVLFILLALLEECGYMSRIAFIMDRIFHKFGLSGKSFIPMLIGTGCGVPGVMASRTIESDHDRKMTVITTTFMPCSAKLPIIALISGALFPDASWVAPASYFIGVASIITSGIVLKKTKMFGGDPAPFVMELPSYHIPTFGAVGRSVWERASSFVKKAGTVILLATILVWALSSFGFENGSFGASDMENSLLASIGHAIKFLFVPLGWGHWKAAVAAFTGLIAKENIIGTFGILFRPDIAEVAEDGQEIWTNVAQSFGSQAAGFSYLMFNLLCAPCFAAIGAIKREMNNAKWTWFAIAYQCIFAYVVSLCTFQIWNAIATKTFGVGLVVAIILAICFLFLLFRPDPRKSIKGAGARANSF